MYESKSFKTCQLVAFVTVLVWCLNIHDNSRFGAVANAFVTPQNNVVFHRFSVNSKSQQGSSFGRNLVISHYGGEAGRREAEIRRKISQLKKEGKLKKNQQSSEYDDEPEISSAKEKYTDKIRQKLGDRKSKMLGYVGTEKDDAKDEEEIEASLQGQLGTLPTQSTDYVEEGGYMRPTESGKQSALNQDSFGYQDDDDEETSDEDLEELVARKLMEKRQRERQQIEERRVQEARERLSSQNEKHQKESEQIKPIDGQITTGIGGSWNKNETSDADLYQPKTGSWGAFPRPRDISKAYGGGRRVGPGFSNEEARMTSAEETRAKLQAYREKAGIDVQSEKDHAAEIEEALRIGGLAMQRGMYSTAVTALEKVTKYCSSNSKVGGKVFLELAMAYEAVGRTQEAITVYTTLTRCRIDEIKANAKRLLYGIEAFNFMRKEMKDSNFSRKKVKNTFIDTTGLANIAQNFDDVYNTAYIDLQGNFYKRLTESVVRSSREARQIILRATNAGEVDRMRIVQALRSLSRDFEDALEKEIERTVVQEPVAVMDGKPIVAPRPEENVGSADAFVLADSEQMLENLSGNWRLQLLADKSGDGVKFFNNTLSWQQVDMVSGKFSAEVPTGFYGTVQVSGMVKFNKKKRILLRSDVRKSGGVFSALVNPLTGVLGAVRVPQQVMTVDSTLMVTRGVPSKKSQASKDDDKDYFAVWRRARE